MFSCLALHFLRRFHGTPALQLRMDDGHVARALLRWLAMPVSAAGVAGRARDTGRLLRSAVLVPALRCAVSLCLVMSAVVLFEKASMGAVSLYAKVFRRRSHRVYRCGPVAGDEEAGSGAYPVVLVQIPMYNEKEVYRLSIGAACNLVWPEDRIVIQVLDDSTDPFNVSQVIRNHSVTACSCRVRD